MNSSVHGKHVIIAKTYMEISTDQGLHAKIGLCAKKANAILTAQKACTKRTQNKCNTTTLTYTNNNASMF